MKRFMAILAAMGALSGAGRAALSATVQDIPAADMASRVADSPIGAAGPTARSGGFGLARLDPDRPGEPYAEADDAPARSARPADVASMPRTDTGPADRADPAGPDPDGEGPFGVQAPDEAPDGLEDDRDEFTAAAGASATSVLEGACRPQWGADARAVFRKAWGTYNSTGGLAVRVHRDPSQQAADGPHVAAPPKTTADVVATVMIALGLVGPIVVGLGAYIHSRRIPKPTPYYPY